MSVPFTIHLLGSGSKGNSVALACGDEILLVDAGFSRRELERRMNLCGLDPAGVKAVLLTHEHSDHMQGCRVFCNSRKVPLYVTGPACDVMADDGVLPEHSLVNIFAPGIDFAVGGFEVRSFRIGHDAAEPVGFVIRRAGAAARVGVATDMGHMREHIAAELCDCDVLVIESNYCEDMLEASDRDIRLKTRIRSARGHLDNTECMEVLPQLIGERTKMVYFAHISQECNSYDLVRELARKSIGGKVDFIVAEQAVPSRGFEILQGRLL